MRRLPCESEASLLMGYIQGEGRSQGTLFPVVLDDFVPADHMCRVIDAFVEKLAMSELGFERGQAAETAATWLRSARFVETVSVWLSVPDPLFATLGS
jgi:hypothetical protein